MPGYLQLLALVAPRVALGSGALPVPFMLPARPAPFTPEL